MRLAALVDVPPGSLRLARLPRVLRSGPVTGGFGRGPWVFDERRAWRVPEAKGTVLAWYSAHHPGGLALSGSGTDFLAPFLTSDEFDVRSSSAWTGAQVAITVAPDGADESLVRADAVTLVLDSTPYRDTFVGSRIQVTGTLMCPATDRGVVGVTAPRPPLWRSLLPAGKPTGGVVCIYSGTFHRPHFVVARRRPLSTTAAGVLAARIDRLPLGHVYGPTYTGCVLDFGTADVVALTYADGRTADLWVETSGCPIVANGDIAADNSLHV